MMGKATCARTPALSARSAACSGKKYMSAKQVTPRLSISAMARSVPTRTASAETNRRSKGQMASSSQACKGRSSAAPRSRLMAAWQWALTNPGSRTWSARSMDFCGWNCSARSATRPTARMRPPSTATAPRSMGCGDGAMGKHHRPLIISSQGAMGELYYGVQTRGLTLAASVFAGGAQG